MEIGYGDQNKMAIPMAEGRFVQPTIKERLLQRKERLESDLKDINAALEALEANPEVMKVLCLISKVNY